MSIMLSKSRIASIICLALGVALVVWGIVAPMTLVLDARLPLDLKKTTYTLHSDNAQAFSIAEGRYVEAPLTRQLHVDLLPPKTSDEVGVKVGLSDRFDGADNQSDLQTLLSASVWAYTMDRTSGAALSPAVVSDQLASPDQTVDIAGQWLKFPTNADAQEYQFFDATARQSFPAQLQESATVDGRVINRYRQEIAPVDISAIYPLVGTTQIPVSAPGPVIPEDAPEGTEPPAGDTPPAPAETPAPEETPAPAEEPAAIAPAVGPGGDKTMMRPVVDDEEPPAEEGEDPVPAPAPPVMIDAKLHHSAVRDIYVDQISGLIVNVEEHVDDYYADPQGGKAAQFLLMDARMGDEQVKQMLEQVSSIGDGKSSKILIYSIVPTGILLIIVGIAGALGAFDVRKKEPEDDEASDIALAGRS